MNQRLPQLATQHNCTGCMACVGSCGAGALTMQIGNDGHGYPLLDAEKCVGCLRCEKVCSNTRMFIGCNELDKSIPFSVWANDNELRGKSTSGGFAAAASIWIINNNGVVVGVSFDGRRAKHILVDKEENLSQIQGSKYVWSDASNVYKAISENLKKRPVLFTGTGCQVAGVLSFFDKHPNKDRLFTIDLICGGVPSDLLIEAYKKTNPEVSSITSFRTKRKYELKGIVDGKEMVMSDSALPLAGFCTEQTCRYTCYDCPFAFAHRASDITIGDLWGESAVQSQRREGISLVVVHNDKGMILLKESNVTYMPLEWDSFLQDNRRLVYGHTPITALRAHLNDNYKKMDSSSFARTYSLSSSPKQLIGFGYRVWNYVLRKINIKKSRNEVNRILANYKKEKS